MKIGDIVKFKDESKNPETGVLMVASTPWRCGNKHLIKLALLDVRQDSYTGALIVTRFEKLSGAVVVSEVAGRYAYRRRNGTGKTGRENSLQ